MVDQFSQEELLCRAENHHQHHGHQQYVPAASPFRRANGGTASSDDQAFTAHVRRAVELSEGVHVDVFKCTCLLDNVWIREITQSVSTMWC